ncbi:MAG: hypothetical protein Q4G40_05450 [Brachybacterium sp.]|nr:hypothetical protein [Brachybacterium sp.]
MAKDDNETLEGMREEAVRRQDNLAADIDELVDRLNPKNAFERWKNETTAAAKSFFVADDGEPDLPRIAAVAGGVIGVLGATVGLIVLASRSGGND